MPRYHREVYWKQDFNDAITEFFRSTPAQVHYTHHAKARMTERNLPRIELEQLKTGDIFELEFIDERLIKIVVRFPIQRGRDMIAAVMKDSNGLVIKSVWTCWHSDNHKTLDASAYERGDVMGGGS